MKFGIAKDLITPDVKTHMGGYGNLHGQYSVGIHDDLYVKALVMDDDRHRAVLISFDLLFHDYALTERLGEYIESRHGIPGENLIVSYTHTHAGPAVLGYDPGQHSDEYEAFLLERTKSCLDRACNNVFEGTIAYGTIEGDWNMNRRRPGNGKPTNAPNPEGDKDNTLGILSVHDQDGVSKALLLNYSCHPVTLGATLWISAEYPGRMCQLLEAEFYGSTAIFFQGAGGCSRPKIAADGKVWKACTFDELDDMATAMANNVKRAICAGKLEPIELRLAARQFVVPLDIEVYPKEFFAKIVNDPNAPNAPQKNEARWVLEHYDDMGDQVPLHAAIMRLSDDLYVAFLCGEVTYPVKQHVLKAFGDKQVIFVGYGDATAYIPDDRYIEEGGYEAEGSVVEFRQRGCFKTGVDQKLIDTYGKYLQDIRAQDD